MKSLIVNGIKVYYEERFNKKPQNVLLVHGLCGDHQGLLDCTEKLSNYHIYSLDLPGYGHSQPLNIKHTIKNYADFLESFRQALGITKFNLIAHSFGAAIAYVYAQRYPDSTNKMILLNPAFDNQPTISRQFSRLYSNLALRLPDRLSHFLLCNRLIVYASDKAIMTKEGKPLHRKILSQDYDNYRRVDIHALEDSIYSLDHLKIDWRTIHKTKDEVLIILGESDILVRADSLVNNQIISANSTIVLMPGGHLLPLEKPDEIGQLIKNFLLV